MTQVALINRSSLDDAMAAFMVEALNVQMTRDFAPAWKGFEPVPFRFYSSTDELPTASGAVVLCTLLDSLRVEGVLGYHTDIGGVQYIEVGARGWDTSTTLSHEFFELEGDPTAAAWIKLPTDPKKRPVGIGARWTHIAAENCDPCERDYYEIEVTLFGRTERVRVSDFLLPEYFKEDGQRPFTFLDTVDEPFGLSRNGGGYRMLLDANTGQTFSSVAGAHEPDAEALASLQIKLANRFSRAARRMHAPPILREG
jgi:hypothetical protein